MAARERLPDTSCLEERTPPGAQAFRLTILKVQSLGEEEQQQQHLGTYYKCTFSGPTSNTFYQNLWWWGLAICVLNKASK